MDTPRPSRGRLVRRRLRQRRACQLAVCLAAVGLAVPALFAGASVPSQAEEGTTVVVAGAAPRSGAVVAMSPSTSTRRSTTTVAPSATTAVPADTTPTPEAAPATTVEAVTWHPPTTTTPQWTAPPSTAPPATAAPAPAAVRPSRSESGVASYYDDPNGGCAHKTLPFGTVVHITASNGRTATCVVDDRGPFGPGRILDLDTSIFAQLAPLSAGLVTVTATW